MAKSKTAVLSIRIVSDASKARKGFNDATSAVDKFKSGLDKAAGIATAAGLGIAKLAYDSFKAASDLQQSSGAVATVFKGNTREITDFARSAWKNVGLSQHETQEMATILGSQLKNMGLPLKDVAGQTKNLVTLGADLAATFGGTTSDAVSALSALLRGERDPIERYGVTIKDATIKAKMAEMGLNGLSGAAAEQAKLQATLALLTEQTADAQGMFARESNTAAGQTQIMRAAFTDAKAALGEALLPIMTQAAQKLTELARWAQENKATVQDWAVKIGVAAAAIIGLNAAVKTISAGIAVFRGVSTAVKTSYHFINDLRAGYNSAAAAASAFTGTAGTLGGKLKALTVAAKANTAEWIKNSAAAVKAGAVWAAGQIKIMAVAAAKGVATAAQWLWNAALNANPIVLVIGGIIAAIALMIANWDKVKPVVQAVWDGIQAAGQWVFDNVLKPIGDFVGTVFTAAWQSLSTAATAVWDTIKTAAAWVWDNILKPIGLFIAGGLVLQWKAMQLAAQLVWNAIKTAAAWVWDNILKPIGQFVGGTLSAVWRNVQTVAGAAWNGIAAGARSVWNFLQTVAGFVRGALSTAWNTFSSIAGGAIRGVVNAISNLVGWIRSAIDWAANLGSNIANAIGSFMGFSAAPGAALTFQSAGLQVTAAPGGMPAPSISKQAVQVQNNQPINITVNMPNYVGDKREVQRWLEEALKKIERRKQGVIYA